MSFEVLESAVSLAAPFERAFMGFFAGVTPHVNDQHVLRLMIREGERGVSTYIIWRIMKNGEIAKEMRKSTERFRGGNNAEQNRGDRIIFYVTNQETMNSQLFNKSEWKIHVDWKHENLSEQQ